MFDFRFDGDPLKETEDWLVFIKHQLPRWCNSIPDAEFRSLWRLSEGCVSMLETGIGASSLVLLARAMKDRASLRSWDPHEEKAAYLRHVAADALEPILADPVHYTWTYVPSTSRDEHLGLSILREMSAHPDFCFLDSEHTTDNLVGEVSLLAPQLREGAIVCIDDAQYRQRHVSTHLVNMRRVKLGLPPVTVTDNEGCRFDEATVTALRAMFPDVERLPDPCADLYATDPWFSYYASDRRAMDQQGLPRTEHPGDRFAAWRVAGRR